MQKLKLATVGLVLAVLIVMVSNVEREGADARTTRTATRESPDAGDPEDRPNGERRESKHSESGLAPVTESRDAQWDQIKEYLASERPTLRQKLDAIARVDKSLGLGDDDIYSLVLVLWKTYKLDERGLRETVKLNERGEDLENVWRLLRDEKDPAILLVLGLLLTESCLFDASSPNEQAELIQLVSMGEPPERRRAALCALERSVFAPPTAVRHAVEQILERDNSGLVVEAAAKLVTPDMSEITQGKLLDAYRRVSYKPAKWHIAMTFAGRAKSVESLFRAFDQASDGEERNDWAAGLAMYWWRAADRDNPSSEPSLVRCFGLTSDPVLRRAMVRRALQSGPLMSTTLSDLLRTETDLKLRRQLEEVIRNTKPFLRPR